jgi:flagellar biosynthetic protein FliS
MNTPDLSTERPTAILVRLFDRIIANIEHAADCCQSGEVEARYHAIVAATDILVALHDGLDLDSDDAWTQQTGAIYRAVLGELPKVIIKSDRTVAEKAVKALIPLRSAWAEADAAAAMAERPFIAVAAE